MSANYKLVALAVLTVGGCLWPTDVCSCPPALGIGTVAGFVVRSDGAPAPGAIVRVHVPLRTCGDTLEALVDATTTRATNDGRYRFDLRSISPSDTACLSLHALDTAGGRADSVALAGIRMRLVPSYGSRRTPDSLRVDLLLP